MITHRHRTILGDIPESWDTTSLGDCLADHSSGDWGEEEGEVELSVLRSTNFTNTRRLDMSDVARRRFAARKAAAFDLKAGDILLERSGGGPAQPVGRVVVLDQDMPGFGYSNFVQMLRVDPDRMDPNYVAWALYALHGSGVVERLQHQTTQMRNLDYRDYLRVLLPKPSKTEQKQIAATVTAADRALHESNIELMRAMRMKSALLQQLFTFGPRAGKGPLHVSKWLRVPSHWTRTPLWRIASVVSGFTMGRDLTGHDVAEVPYVTVINVQEGRLDLRTVSRIHLKVSELGTDLLEPGDVLMTEGGDRDKLGRGSIWRGEITPCAFQNHIFRVRFYADTMEPLLFHYLLQTYRSKRYFFSHAKQTNNLCTINSRELKRLEVAVPPPDERKEMLSLLVASEDAIATIDMRVAALERVKRSLLQNLVCGGVRLKLGAVTASAWPAEVLTA